MPLEEIETLREELAHMEKRYAAADNEGKRILKTQIRQIKRDIERNSKGEQV